MYNVSRRKKGTHMMNFFLSSTVSLHQAILLSC